MNTAKNCVRSILDKLPDDCTIEDVQYHLYVIEKIEKGIERAENESVLSQAEMDENFNKWKKG